VLAAITADECLIDGNAAPAAGLVHLAPAAWDRYIQSSGPGTIEHGITIDRDRASIRIRTHPFGLYPLSYYAAQDLIIISQSARLVAEELCRRGKAAVADRVAIWEAMFFSLPLLSRTLYRGIRKTRIGEHIAIDVRSGKAHSLSNWRPCLTRGRDSRGADVAEAAEVLRQQFDLPYSGRLLVPLSGGLDSRLIAGQLQQRSLDLRAFTFGSFGSAEVTFARRVAGELHIPWEFMSLAPDDYVSYGDRVVDLTGGLVSGMHMHLYSTVSKLDHGDGSISIHGFLGDPIAGDHAAGFQHFPTTAAAAAAFVSKRLSRSALAARFLPPDDRAAILAEIEALAEECAGAGSLECFEEYFFIAERQNLISYIPALMETHLPVLRPYASQPYMDYFLNRCPGDRIGRSLFRRAFRFAFPDLYRLPSTAHVFGPGIHPNAQKLWVRVRNWLQYATMAISGNSVRVFSPYLYEQHLFLMRTALRDRLQHSAAAVSSYLDTDAAALIRAAVSIAERRCDIGFTIMAADRALSKLSC